MQKPIWDGNTRRKNDIYLQAIEKKVDRVFAFLCQQFGDIDLAGNKIEGKVTTGLRELNEKVSFQNGRVTKLEERKIFLDGMVKLAAIIGATIISAGTLIVMIIKK